MIRRSLLVLCLALVILARGVHCLSAEVGLVARAVASVAGELPLTDPTEGDPNESGCLCKGAIVHAVCPLACLDLAAKSVSSGLAITAAPVAVVLLFAARVPQDSSLPPPLSGRIVRALLVIWQV